MSPAALFLGGILFVWAAKYGIIDRLIYGIQQAVQPGSPQSGGGGPGGGGGGCSGKSCSVMRAELIAAGGGKKWANASCDEVKAEYLKICKG